MRAQSDHRITVSLSTLVCFQATGKMVGRKVFKTSGELEGIGMPDDQLESGADESE